jgi:hypothetical protein
VKGAQNSKKKISAAIGKSEKIYLKFFRNIPKADVEMIFPDPKPRMKPIHKLKAVGPLVIGIGISLKELIYDPYILKITEGPMEKGISIELLAILGGLFGYAYKAYSDYKKIVNDFLREISQSLYFREMGNNEAGITALIDEAEEQEYIEAILGYYFLLKSDKPLNVKQLDRLIEFWMEDKHNKKIDFDVVGALDKLAELNILNRTEDGYLEVPKLKKSLEEMDKIWDNYFQYHVA